jgi:cytosine deaminase
VAEAPSAQVTLHLPGRPAATDFRMPQPAAK